MCFQWPGFDRQGIWSLPCYGALLGNQFDVICAYGLNTLGQAWNHSHYHYFTSWLKMMSPLSDQFLFRWFQKRVVWQADPTFGAGHLQTACSGSLWHQHSGEMPMRQKGRLVPCWILQCSSITTFTSTCSKQLFEFMVIKVHSFLHLCLQSWRKFSIPDQEWNKGIDVISKEFVQLVKTGILFF